MSSSFALVKATPTPRDDAKPHKRALKSYTLNGYVIRGRGPCNSNAMLFWLCTASPTFPRNMATSSTQLNLLTNVVYLDLVHVVVRKLRNHLASMKSVLDATIHLGQNLTLETASPRSVK